MLIVPYIVLVCLLKLGHFERPLFLTVELSDNQIFSNSVLSTPTLYVHIHDIWLKTISSTWRLVDVKFRQIWLWPELDDYDIWSKFMEKFVMRSLRTLPLCWHFHNANVNNFTPELVIFSFRKFLYPLFTVICSVIYLVPLLRSGTKAMVEPRLPSLTFYFQCFFYKL